MFIQVKNLTKQFKNNIAVNKISFNIKKNQTMGLLGANGCGKTTSIGMMLGLIKPTKGEILIDNQNINESNRVNILSRMNFASPYVELPKKLTVKQNLEVYARLYGVKEIEVKPKISRTTNRLFKISHSPLLFGVNTSSFPSHNIPKSFKSHRISINGTHQKMGSLKGERLGCPSNKRVPSSMSNFFSFHHKNIAMFMENMMAMEAMHRPAKPTTVKK